MVIRGSGLDGRFSCWLGVYRNDRWSRKLETLGTTKATIVNDARIYDRLKCLTAKHIAPRRNMPPLLQKFGLLGVACTRSLQR